MSIRRTIKTAVCMAAVAMAGVGCMGTPVKMVSAPAERLDMSRKRTVSGGGAGFQLFLLIPIGVNGRMERAYQELQQNAGSDQLTNIKVEDSWVYAFVGTVYHTKLTATAAPAKP